MIKNYFETRRQFPRLKTDIKAIAVSQTGIEFPAVIQDISPDGAQITYKGKDDELLFEKSAKYDVLKKLKVKLIFNLPFSVHEHIEIDTHPVHHHHLGNQVYIVGLLFNPDDIEQKEKIRDFLFYEAEPNIEDLINFYGSELADNSKQAITENNIIEEITLNTTAKENKSSKNKMKSDGDHELKKELLKINNTLYSLVSSIKLIEDKLSRIERKIFK